MGRQSKVSKFINNAVDVLHGNPEWEALDKEVRRRFRVGEFGTDYDTLVTKRNSLQNKLLGV